MTDSQQQFRDDVDALINEVYSLYKNLYQLSAESTWIDLANTVDLIYDAFNVLKEYKGSAKKEDIRLYDTLRDTIDCINNCTSKFKTELPNITLPPIFVPARCLELIVHMTPSKTHLSKHVQMDLAIKVFKTQIESYIGDTTRQDQQEKLTALKQMQTILMNTKNEPSHKVLDQFNTKFTAFTQKFAKTSEKEKEINWKPVLRVLKAIATAGIYGIVRGYQLGSPKFWKSRKDVLSEKVKDHNENIDRLTNKKK